MSLMSMGKSVDLLSLKKKSVVLFVLSFFLTPQFVFAQHSFEELIQTIERAATQVQGDTCLDNLLGRFVSELRRTQANQAAIRASAGILADLRKVAQIDLPNGQTVNATDFFRDHFLPQTLPQVGVLDFFGVRGLFLKNIASSVDQQLLLWLDLLRLGEFQNLSQSQAGLALHIAQPDGATHNYWFIDQSRLGLPAFQARAPGFYQAIPEGYREYFLEAIRKRLGFSAEELERERRITEQTKDRTLLLVRTKEGITEIENKKIVLFHDQQPQRFPEDSTGLEFEKIGKEQSAFKFKKAPMQLTFEGGISVSISSGADEKLPTELRYEGTENELHFIHNSDEAVAQIGRFVVTQSGVQQISPNLVLQLAATLFGYQRNGKAVKSLIFECDKTHARLYRKYGFQDATHRWKGKVPTNLVLLEATTEHLLQVALQAYLPSPSDREENIDKDRSLYEQWIDAVTKKAQSLPPDQRAAMIEAAKKIHPPLKPQVSLSPLVTSHEILTISDRFRQKLNLSRMLSRFEPELWFLEIAREALSEAQALLTSEQRESQLRQRYLALHQKLGQHSDRHTAYSWLDTYRSELRLPELEATIPVSAQDKSILVENAKRYLEQAQEAYEKRSKVRASFPAPRFLRLYWYYKLKRTPEYRFLEQAREKYREAFNLVTHHAKAEALSYLQGALQKKIEAEELFRPGNSPGWIDTWRQELGIVQAEATISVSDETRIQAVAEAEEEFINALKTFQERVRSDWWPGGPGWSPEILDAEILLKGF